MQETIRLWGNKKQAFDNLFVQQHCECVYLLNTSDFYFF